MKKSVIPLFATVLFLSAAVSAQAPGSPESLRLTLEQCLDYALGRNYTRQSVLLNEQAREADLDQARQSRLPDLSAGFSEGVSHTNAGGTDWSGNYDLSTSVTLYQGGQINHTIRQTEQQYEQTKLQTRQYDNDLTIRVLQAFLTALGNKELLKYQESILETSQSQLTDGRAKFGAGQILESDYLLLEAQYASDQDNVTSTRISLENNLISLKNLMSVYLPQPVELVDPDDSALERMVALPSRPEVVARGLESMPDVKISDYNVEIAESGVSISKSSRYPTLSLSGGVGTGHVFDFRDYGRQLSDRFGPQAGVTLSVPIFNRGQTRGNIRRSGIALQQAELEHKQAIMDIEEMLINEYGNVVAAVSRYKASQISQNAYLSSFQAYTELFGAGAITTVELLQQQNNYISAMNDYIQSKYTFLIRRKVLDVFMGEPVTM